MSIFKRKEVIYLWQIKDVLPVESGTQGRRNSVRNAGGVPAKDENRCSENKKNIRKDEKKR